MRLPLVLLAATLAAACNKETDVDLTNATPEQVANAMKESGIASDMRQPGLWATTMTVTDMQVPGMPPEMVERMKQTLGAGQRQEVCVTQAEIDKLDSFIGQNNANCTFNSYKVGGGKIAGKATCKPTPEVTQTMTMSGSYTKTTSDMTMTSELTGGPAQMNGTKTTMNVKSERVGDCPSQPKAG